MSAVTLTQPRITTMDKPNTALPANPAMVRQHAQDAAFYWSQLDNSARQQHIGIEKYRQFNRYLHAHLEGLWLSAELGAQFAHSALQRWNGAGEVFVCAYLAALNDNDHDDDNAANSDAIRHALLAHVEQDPERMLRGLISALAWLPQERSVQWLIELSRHTASPCAQVAALRAIALLGPSASFALQHDIAHYCKAESPHVRASACRVLGYALATHPQAAHLLQRASQDKESTVRAEAALALARQGDLASALPVLWQCILIQTKQHEQATGWYRKQAERRLLRYLQHLAGMLALGYPNVSQLLQQLPYRAALHFVLYHADPSYLPFVLRCMHDEAQQRFAGWVWHRLTGVEMQALCLPEPARTNQNMSAWSAQARADADDGLPLPDIFAIAAHPANRQWPEPCRIINGQRLDRTLALQLLAQGTQDLRAIAANLLAYANRGITIPIRGPLNAQMGALQKLQSA